jgi:excisionase family DNA binding protein
LNTSARQTAVIEMQKPYYSIYEVAEITGQHWQTVRNHIIKGRLKASKPGAQWRISKDALKEYLQEAN